jgi:hypothetical protein
VVQVGYFLLKIFVINETKADKLDFALKPESLSGFRLKFD